MSSEWIGLKVRKSGGCYEHGDELSSPIKYGVLTRRGTVSFTRRNLT
jgi:hypothetical protein